jgi:DNA polymerase III epsilon subunit-like protein
MRGFTYVDVETSGLVAGHHEIIEFAVITEIGDRSKVYTGALPFDMDRASPEALEVNGYGKREFPREVSGQVAASRIYEMTDDRHLVGKNPGFDAGFLEEFLALYGGKPNWHHRLVDIGALAWGYYNGRSAFGRGGPTDIAVPSRLEPPNTDETAELMGIPRPLTNEGYHCALYDAAWAQEVFRSIVPVGQEDLRG